jgi:ABC transporter, phosphonate, periplasmic substrate-binding protein
MRTSRSLLLAGLVAASSAAIVPSPAAAAPRELVVTHEVLVDAGEHLGANMEKFVRRVEEVTGFPKGSLKGKAFARPAEALAYIRKNRVGFAILPAHQVAEAQAALKLEVLGRAVGLDGAVLQFSTVTRKPRPFTDVNVAPGLRVAASETYDPAWLALLTEGDLDPRRRPVELVEVPSSKAALAALEAKKVDLAILHPLAWKEVKPRTDEGGDLEWIVTSPKMPPSAFVAVGKFVNAADKKKMAAGVDKVCKTTGADTCGRMGIMYIEAGGGESYADIVNGYAERR